MNLIIKSALLGIFIFYIQPSIAQSGFITTYYSTSGTECKKDEAHYYEIKREKLNKIDTVIGFYSSSNKLRSIETVNNYGVDEGAFTYYHDNGVVKSKGKMQLGRPVGEIISYYASGKIQAVESFPKADGKAIVRSYYDSLDNQLVKDGDGFGTFVPNSYKWNSHYETGRYKKGLKDSIWVGNIEARRIRFSEIYKGGELKSGTSYDSTGKSYSYTILEEIASPKRGMQGFYEHVGKKLRYPAEARRSGIQGKVFIQFVIEHDGTLSNLVCLKGIGGGCDEEAVRVVGTSDSWNPGKYRGQPVKQRMVLPLTFKLG